MNRRIGMILTAVLSWLLCSGLYAAEKPLYAGILTRIHNEWQNTDYVKAYVLFQKQGREWVSLPHDSKDPGKLAKLNEEYPASIRWSILYHGAKIGSLTGIKPGKIRFYSELGSQVVSSDLTRIPFKTDDVDDYYSWQGPFTARPMVLVSKQNFDDPEAWRAYDLSAIELQKSRDLYHKLVPLIPDCDEESGDVISNNSYPAEDIQPIKSYRSKENEVIAGLSIDDTDSDCEVTPDEYINHWFLMENGRIKYLGLGMVPIDAEDLDGDGRSEWLFASGGEGVDSYILFYDDFKKHARFDIFYN
jgi:hypothetical protein